MKGESKTGIRKVRKAETEGGIKERDNGEWIIEKEIKDWRLRVREDEGRGRRRKR